MKFVWYLLAGVCGGVLAGMGMGGGLVKGAPLPYILIPALAATAAASFFAREGGETLGKLYGGFLVLIAAGGLVSGVLPGRAGK